MRKRAVGRVVENKSSKNNKSRRDDMIVGRCLVDEA